MSARGAPDAGAVRAWLRDNPDHRGFRDIARAFGVRDEPGRRALRGVLRELRAEGAYGRAARGSPRVLVVEVTGLTDDGEALARPVEWRGAGPAPDIVIVASRRRGPPRPAPGPGERALVRLEDTDETPIPARVLARVPGRPARFVGVVVHDPPGTWWIEDCAPSGKRSRVRLPSAAAAGAGVEDGEVVVAGEPGDGGAGPAVRERVGRIDDPRSIPVLVAARHGLPAAFGPEAEAEADAAGPPDARGRDDLSAVPFVTIDGEDAKDYDDAVAAVPDGAGGFRILVAVADVAHYVRPGSALDREARERGNSTYLPGHVIPMLPAPLSDGWCSLVPGEPRGAAVAEIDVGPDGTARAARFRRALIRSRARLTYEEVQAAADGRGRLPPDADDTREPLYGAFRLLADARERREALALEFGEERIELDAGGEVRAIAPVARLDSHRLIEEFMILANVAVARELAEAGVPFLYRVHDEPPPARVGSLREELGALGIRFPRTGPVTTGRLNETLRLAEDRDRAGEANLAVVRSQALAEYSPRNIGHFGLALPCYTHFTSPIRRYADLVAHRALLHHLGLEGGAREEADGLEELARHVSERERRSVDAEREAARRYACRLHARDAGRALEARIVRVERYGMFVRIGDTGAEGLLPVRSLGSGYFRHDPARQELRGERGGPAWRLGDGIRVRVAEADPAKGRLTFAPAR